MIGHTRLIALAAIITAVAPTSALADPCKGPLPSKGSRFSGIVRYVGDGDSLCLGPAARPDRWVEVHIADFYAPELHEAGGRAAKRRLERIAKGKKLLCTAGRRSYDRVIATCTFQGRPISALLKAAGGVEGGRGRSR